MELSTYLARNVTALRQKRGLSQNQLAKLAGLPRSTVTYMESGEGNPSLHNLSKLAGAFQVTIEELLSRPRAQVHLIPAREVRVIQKGQGAVDVYKLLPDSIPGAEIDRIEIVPGGRMGGIPHVAHTKEYLIGVQGEVQVQVAGQKFLVKAGDVLAFPGDQAHSYHNPGRTKAVGLSVVMSAPLHI